jgi:allophanate hydrolase
MLPALKDETPAAPDRVAAFRRLADAASPTIFIERGPVIHAAAPAGAARSLEGRIFAVKDNIDVAGYATTAGCPDFAYHPERSATVVQRLLQAGAAVVGKTNLDQFACGLVGTRSPYGAVPNAFNANYISGGSSSGSAVAVALGLVDFALGTDTAGSGRVPAGFNNIVGFKPSRGLLSTHGVLPACAHIDCPSIFTRSVPEAVEVLLAAAGHDPQDPWSRQLQLDNRGFPARFRFGVPDARHLEFCDDELAEHTFTDAIARMKALGGEQVEMDFEAFAQAATRLYEDAWVAERYAAIRQFYDQHPDSIDPVVRAIVGAGRNYDAAQLFQAMTQMSALRQRAQLAMQGIDVLMVPTSPTIYTLRQIAEHPIQFNRNLGLYTNAVNLLDLAAIAVPSAMRADGLPTGITLISDSGSDLRLAELAARYHAATGLGLGVSEEPVPLAKSFAHLAGGTVDVAVVGAHLSGMPLNHQLAERGAQLLRRARTASHYRLYALADTQPPKPGLLRVGRGEGANLELEIWRLPMASYGSFVSLVPAPLCIGTLDLEDGSRVQGFLCEKAGLAGARDITGYGGWRAFMKSARSPAATGSNSPSNSPSNANASTTSI